jgi:organic radical activating enzyme
MSLLKIAKASIVQKLKCYPWYVTVEYTAKCNLHCCYCGRTLQGKNESAEISLEIFEKILKAVYNQSPCLEKMVVGGWGEPTQHRQFIELNKILRKFTPRNVRLKLFTNGTFPKNYARSIADTFDEVTFSLNHPTRQDYLRLNGADYFDNVVENIHEVLGLPHGIINVQQLNLSESYFQVEGTNLVVEPLDRQVNSPSQQPATPCYKPHFSLALTLEGDAYPCCLARLLGPKSGMCLGNITVNSIQSIIAKKKEIFKTFPKACFTCDLWRRGSVHFIKYHSNWRLIA